VRQPESWIDRLPDVTPSSGLTAVSAATMRMRSSVILSSSAAIWRGRSRFPGRSRLSAENRHGSVAVHAKPLRQFRIFLQTSRPLERAFGDGVHRAISDARKTARTMRFVRTAAAQVAVERAPLRSRSAWDFSLGARRADQNAAGAIAALRRLLGEKGVLEGVQLAAFAQAFDGSNSLTRGRPQRHVTSGAG